MILACGRDDSALQHVETLVKLRSSSKAKYQIFLPSVSSGLQRGVSSSSSPSSSFSSVSSVLSNSSSSSPAVVERQERGRRVNDGKDNERNCLRLWGLLEQVFRFDAVQSPGATPLHIVANALKENSEVRKKEPERGVLCGV